MVGDTLELQVETEDSVLGNAADAMPSVESGGRLSLYNVGHLEGRRFFVNANVERAGAGDVLVSVSSEEIGTHSVSIPLRTEASHEQVQAGHAAYNTEMEILKNRGWAWLNFGWAGAIRAQQGFAETLEAQAADLVIAGDPLLDLIVRGLASQHAGEVLGFIARGGLILGGVSAAMSAAVPYAPKLKSLMLSSMEPAPARAADVARFEESGHWAVAMQALGLVYQAALSESKDKGGTTIDPMAILKSLRLGPDGPVVSTLPALNGSETVARDAEIALWKAWFREHAYESHLRMHKDRYYERTDIGAHGHLSQRERKNAIASSTAGLHRDDEREKKEREVNRLMDIDLDDEVAGMDPR